MNKGFTLVELLAVVVILSLLALITSVSITSVVKNSKKNLYNTQLESIKASAKMWGSENMDKLPTDNSCLYMTLKDLEEYGLVDKDIKNAKTGELLDDNMYIKISSHKNEQYDKDIIDYEVDSNDISGCTHFNE